MGAFLAMLISGPILVILIFGQWSDIEFYRLHKWNFELDNPEITKRYYTNSESGSDDPADIMSNRTRVLFGRPFMICMLLLTFVASLYNV